MKTPNVVATDCFIHREALALKTAPDGLKCAFDLVIKIANYIKSHSLNSRMFQKLCQDLNSDHKYLPSHTKMRWLSICNVVARVFELRDELKMFIEPAKPELAVHLKMVSLLLVWHIW